MKIEASHDVRADLGNGVVVVGRVAMTNERTEWQGDQLVMSYDIAWNESGLEIDVTKALASGMNLETFLASHKKERGLLPVTLLNIPDGMAVPQ